MSSVAESLEASMAESLSLSDPAALIPQDLVSCILSSLPVKSLARFRSVSKEWNKLISSPDFIANHISSTESESHDLLVLSKINKFPLDEDPVYDLYQPPFDTCRRLKTPRNRKGYGSFPAGVVHGVVCIFRKLISSSETTVILWNPTIRKHVSIPMTMDVVVEGFGFDPVTNQLKVLASRSGSGRVEFEVASHKDRQWRKLTGVRCDHLGVDNGVVFEQQYFQGSIHWLRYEDGWFLVAFDCAKEEFRTMDFPEELAKCKPPKKSVWWPYGGEISDLIVTQCGACFSIYRFKKDSVGRYLDIWVMGEYGEGSSWVRVIGVPLPGSIMDVRVLLEDWRSFGMWMIDVRCLIKYDIVEKVVKRMIEHPNLVISAKIFKESLLLMDA